MNGVANGVYGGDLPNQINTPWIDFSEQSTIVGWSSYTTKVIKYKITGNMLLCNFNIEGTSNSATTSFTVPYGSKNIFLDSGGQLFLNNGGAVIGRFSCANNVVSFQYWNNLTSTTSTWTASGTKRIQGFFFYEI